ncbi:NAD(P)-binding protein [Xylariaceae sp. FL0804]|nr:NAD(P)-binding protein [Xylariaceae sp. FL0804]
MPDSQPPARAGRGVSAIALEHVLPAVVLAALALASPPSSQWRLWLFSARTALRLGLALSLARSLNGALNAWAANHWRLRANAGWAWDREVAVVTGGAGDIGRALVRGLTARGVRVAVLDLDEPRGPLRDDDDDDDNDERVLFLRCDVSAPSEIAAAADTVRRVFGPPSILVNNAGLIRTNTILDASEDHLRRVVGVNLMAHWFTARAFLPHMVRQNKGHVVTMASLAAYVALPTSVDYSATKAGALAFHEGLACELKHLYRAPGVMTTVVLPDFVRTRMTERYWAEVEAAGGLLLTVDQVVEPVLAQIFARRGGQIIIPRFQSVVSLLRGLPNWLQELVRDIIGRADRAPLDSPFVQK